MSKGEKYENELDKLAKVLLPILERESSMVWGTKTIKKMLEHALDKSSLGVHTNRFFEAIPTDSKKLARFLLTVVDEIIENGIEPGSVYISFSRNSVEAEPILDDAGRLWAVSDPGPERRLRLVYTLKEDKT